MYSAPLTCDFALTPRHTFGFALSHTSSIPSHLSNPTHRLTGFVKSPLSALSNRLYALLAATSPLSSNARKCFAHAILDHVLSPTSDDYSSSLDAQIQHFFATSPPNVVLIQGPFKVDTILEPLPIQPPSPYTPSNVNNPSPTSPNSVSTFSSMSSSTSTNSGPSNLQDAIFLGYTLHNELVRCEKEDREQGEKLTYFALATLGRSIFTLLWTQRIILNLISSTLFPFSSSCHSLFLNTLSSQNFPFSLQQSTKHHIGSLPRSTATTLILYVPNYVSKWHLDQTTISQQSHTPRTFLPN